MDCKLVRGSNKPGIAVSDLPDGDIGEIVEWPAFADMMGRLVVRGGCAATVIGPYQQQLITVDGSACRVRPTAPGDRIEF